MRNLLEAALLSLLFAACASHNSHRVAIDLAKDFDPLLDEAFAKMKEQWPVEQPPLRIATRVEVEPVTVRWQPFEPGPDDSVTYGPVLEQADLAARIAGRLEQLAGPAPSDPAPADYLVEVELLTDLHEPDTVYYQLACRLVKAADPGENLASGESTIVYLPRLYCHGCREHWGGHGTRIANVTTAGSGYEACAVPVFIPCAGSSDGYVKVH